MSGLVLAKCFESLCSALQFEEIRAVGKCAAVVFVTVHLIGSILLNRLTGPRLTAGPHWAVERIKLGKKIL